MAIKLRPLTALPIFNLNNIDATGDHDQIFIRHNPVVNLFYTMLTTL